MCSSKTFDGGIELKKKTRIISVFFCLILAVLMQAFALAESGMTSPSETSRPSETEETKKTEEAVDIDIGNAIYATSAGKVASVIDTLQGFLSQSGKMYTYLHTDIIASTLYSFFFPVGLALFFIAFLLNLNKQAVDGTLFDPSSGGKQSFIKELLSFFSGVIIISISSKLFSLIDGTAALLTQKFAQNDMNAMKSMATVVQVAPYEKSNIPIIGFFVNLVNSIQSALDAGFFITLLLVCYVVVAIVAGIRLLKLAIYRGFSPLMLGLMANENTKNYTRNFIVQYCLISFQILIISALLSSFEVMMTGFFATMAKNPHDYALLGTAGIMVLVFTSMIFKSNKLFEKVFA